MKHNTCIKIKDIRMERVEENGTEHRLLIATTVFPWVSQSKHQINITQKAEQK